VFVTGYSYDDVTSEDHAKIKYNSSGTQQWVSRYNGKGGDYDIATALKTDSKGNVYVTGYSYNFGTEENYATIRYNSNGDEQWVELFNNFYFRS